MITVPLSFLLSCAPVLVQDPPDESAGDTARESSTDDHAARVSRLRERVHGLRRDLLLGGEQVQRAEREAASFYEGRIQTVDRRLDSLEAELSEKRASYEQALRSSLEASSGGARRSAVARAAERRAELQELDEEQRTLQQRREQLAGIVGAVESRSREREALAVRLEATGEGFEQVHGLLLGGGIGLAPEVEPTEASSPLENAGLVEDLMAIDPVAARRVLFEADPEAYWERFPLRPPADVLAEALSFPPPDLPGSR